MGADRGRYGWPALMRATTARDYLDGMTMAQFADLVAPHLDVRLVGEEVRYTRQSLDAWIDAGIVSREGRAREESEKAPVPYADRPSERDHSNKLPNLAPPAVLDKLGLVPAEQVAEMLGISLKTLKNRPTSGLPEFVRAGRRWLFKLDSVREYLEARSMARERRRQEWRERYRRDRPARPRT